MEPPFFGSGLLHRRVRVLVLFVQVRLSTHKLQPPLTKQGTTREFSPIHFAETSVAIPDESSHNRVCLLVPVAASQAPASNQSAQTPPATTSAVSNFCSTRVGMLSAACVVVVACVAFETAFWVSITTASWLHETESKAAASILKHKLVINEWRKSNNTENSPVSIKCGNHGLNYLYRRICRKRLGQKHDNDLAWNFGY